MYMTCIYFFPHSLMLFSINTSSAQTQKQAGIYSQTTVHPQAGFKYFYKWFKIAADMQLQPLLIL